MKVLVPSTIALDVRSEDDLVTYDVEAPLPAHVLDADVLVLWQNPGVQLRDAARTLRRLRLVQTLASGADLALEAGFDPHVPICSGRSLHDGPVAEHALAVTLAAVRRLDRLGDAQRARRWDLDYFRAQSAPATCADYTLAGANVTIWGFGSIAARLAPLLTALGARVSGIARKSGMRAGFPVFAETERRRILRETDVLISLAPATAETQDLFDQALFAALRPGGVFVNVGRGATVDEDALCRALASGQLRAAAIDVTKAEPLPQDSPLWDADNLIITPHVAGNRPVGASQLIQQNLRALKTGSALINEVYSPRPRLAEATGGRPQIAQVRGHEST